jgi:hypothetical protein
MQRKHILFATVSLLLVTVVGCSKDDDGDQTPAPKTKTELLTKATWKFSDAKVNGFSVASFLDDCETDNTATFVAGGNGTANEGGTKCDSGDPQTSPFTWTFQTNETVLFVSTPLFTGGNSTFTIVSLTDTQLVVTQDITVSGQTKNAEITFVH